MTHQEAERLIAVIRELAGPAATLTGGARGGKTAQLAGVDGGGKLPAAKDLEIPTSGTNGGKPVHLSADVLEALYREFRNRMIDDLRTDPIFLQLLAARPELEVEIVPRVVTVDGSTLRGRVARLIAQGWFDTARATGTARKELARTGADPGGGGSLSDVLSGYVREGFLVKEGDGYTKASGLKITEKVLEAR